MNSAKHFLFNLRFFLFSRKAYKRLTALQKSVLALNHELTLLSHQNNNNQDVSLAVDYLRKHPLCTDMFPYEKKRELGEIEIHYDRELKMNYVVHDGRPLYFPKFMNSDYIRNIYRFAIEDDDIIGAGYRQCSPHAYQSERYHIEEGDILIDAGSAEGLLTLNVIDKISKAYLVECDSVWWKALEATFAPYKDKVEIVKSKLSATTNENTIGLKDLLIKNNQKKVFVKMDIEGYETSVLDGVCDYLNTTKNNIIFSVCAYHRTTDYDYIMNYFNSIGYHTEVQPGYMYTNLNDGYGIYTLRKAIIRASSI